MEKQVLNHRKRQHMKYKKRREKEKGAYFVENNDPPFTVRFTPSVEGEKKDKAE